jgi:hypothetical protein
MADDYTDKIFEDIDDSVQSIGRQLNNLGEALEKNRNETNRWFDATKAVANATEGMNKTENAINSVQKQIQQNIRIRSAAIKDIQRLGTRNRQIDIEINDISRKSLIEQGILSRRNASAAQKEAARRRLDDLTERANRLATEKQVNEKRVLGNVANITAVNKTNARLGRMTTILQGVYKEQEALKHEAQRLKDVYDNLIGPLVAESKEFNKIASLGQSLARGGATAWLAIIKASLDRWQELDKAAEDFRKSTGFLVSQTKELDKAARQVNVQMANLGVGLKEAYAAASALTEEFQVIGLVSKEAIANTAMVAANLGLNVKDAAKFKGLFESISQSVGSSGDSMIKSAAALADMAGVAPSAVLKDMAEASEQTLAFLAKSPIALMRATVEARRLGTTVNSLSQSARGLLNYQDSITNELEASALIGKSLSFQEARAAAYAGDVVKARELALKQIEKAGDFTKLNVYQQEALAKAAGMTTAEIIKQQNQQKLLAKLEQSKPELYKKYMEMQQKMKENEKAAAEDLEKQSEEMAKQALMQGEMNKLTNTFSAIWTDISDSLLAIANAIMPPIIVAVRLLGGIFKIIAAVVRGFLAPFDRIGAALRSGADGGMVLEKVMTAILGGVQSIVPYVEKLAEVAGYAVNAFSFLAYIFSSYKTAMKPFEAIAEFFEKIAERVRTFSNGLSGIGKAFKPILQGVAGFVKFLGTFAKFLGPIGLVINAIQLVVSLWKRFSNLFASDEFVNAPWYEKIWLGIKAIGGALYDTLIQPFVDVYDWIKEKLMGSSPSEIGLGIVDGIKSIGGMLLSALTWPFIKVWEFVTGLFSSGGQGSIIDSILGGIKSIGSSIFEFMMWPYRKVKDFLSGLFCGGGILNAIVDGVKSAGAAVFNFLTWPFRKMWEFVSGLFSGEGSGILSAILGGIGSIVSSAFDLLTWPFRKTWEFVTGLFSGEGSGILSTILGGLGSIVSSAFDFLTWPFRKTWEFVTGLFSSEDSGILGSILGGLGSIVSSAFGFLTSPFEKTWDFVSGLFSSEDSGITGSMLGGLESIGSSIIDTLVSPFKAVTDFVSNIFGGDGSIGETIINGIKSVMSGVFELLISPFKSAFNFVKKIPFIGKLFGGGDATASVNDKAKADVEKQVSMVVEIKNLDEFRISIDKLIEAISNLCGKVTGESSGTSINGNQDGIIAKLDELINLLKEGSIGVNMDGVKVSKALAKVS